MSGPGGMTREQLIAEVQDLQKQVEELEYSKSECMLAKAVVQENEEQFRSIIDQAKSVIIYLTADFDILEFNHEAELLYGVKRENALGKNYLETFLPKEAREIVAADIEKVLKGEPSKSFENPVKDADGAVHILSWNVGSVMGPGREVLGVVAVGRDITEDKKAEEALKASEVNYRSIFDSVNDAIMVHDAETGRPLDVNNRMVEMLGYTREELMRKKVADWTAGDPAIAQEKALEKVMEAAQGNPQLFEWHVKNRSGQKFWVEVNLKSAVINNEKRVLAVVRDITERKKAEEIAGLKRSHEGLKASQEQLLQQAKLTSLGRLVSDMAHEVNNPLQVISGRAQVALMGDLKNKKKLKEDFNIIIDQSMRAKDIVQRLLMFSRPSKGEVKKININDSLDFIVDLMSHQYSLEDITIIKDYVSYPVMVEVDDKLMHEVFMNLLKNAADAMPGGGKITIRTDKEKDKARIIFEDTGQGIQKEDMGSIFDPFFTTKDHGTGLGLSVCYGIIKSHGGELTYTSDIGKGTTATISLPSAG